MKFQLRPVLSEMKELYLQPISSDRFKTYIFKLQGDSKDDLKLPIAGYNPMAKEHILQKIEALEAIDAEGIMDTTIQKINEAIGGSSATKIEVVLNLADDWKGMWTDFYVTDFDSKFKINGMLNRNFCVPYFWASESYDEALIQKRTSAYLYRTVYWLANSKPQTLEEHLQQEIYVSEKNGIVDNEITNFDIDLIESLYHKNKEVENYDFIFNFFYGDSVSEGLGYKKYGVNEVTGYDYAKFIAMKRMSNG